MRLYCLSNVNMDSLKFFLKEIEWIKSQSYSNYLVDLANYESALYKEEPDLVFFHLDLAELMDKNIDEILGAIKSYIKQRKVVFIISSVSANPADISTYLNKSLAKETEINQKILEFLRNNDLLLLDFKRLVQKHGYEKIYDDKFWYMGRIRYSNEGFQVIASELLNLLGAYQGKTKKVLVVDLDNTLWGGVIGEDGHAIKLDNEGIGKVYLDFQKQLKQLKDYGILLVINSKNNHEDAISGLNHPMSQLGEDDFVLIKANWQDKVTNLREIVKELNLGIDSVVFIDDSIIEREFVKANLPEVEVPDYPQDIFDLNRWFIEEVVYKHFPRVKLSDEDLKKHEQYKAKFKRQILQNKFKLDYQEFLRSLEIKLTFLEDDTRFIDRYAQLTQKTNQFNLTTKRYTSKDIEQFIDDENMKVIALEYEDKYFKEGIIGLAIINMDQHEAEIDTFLLSCRVLKRDIEYKFVSHIVEWMKNAGKSEVIGRYLPTAKNQLAKDFYTAAGFTRLDENTYRKEIKDA